MHPEVVLLNIGLLTLLYAETTSTYFLKKVSFKYSLFLFLRIKTKKNDIVKKLKQLSLSAGNLYNRHLFLRGQTPVPGRLPDASSISSINGTSETICNETVNNIEENIKNISFHVPKHSKPISENNFGHYLAGLIEGCGHFSSQQELIIVFHPLDVSLAYYIKERLGYGSVIFTNKKVKNKIATLRYGDRGSVIFFISSSKSQRDGLKKVINLINGKIRTENKFNQITKNILNHKNFLEFKNKINFIINPGRSSFSSDKQASGSGNKNFFLAESGSAYRINKNHWLAGFSDAVAGFQIKIILRKNRELVRLNFKINQKNDNLLRLIKEFFGGNIGYSQIQDNYYYGSTSFGSAKKVINYLDSFQLLSSKHVNYLK